jgi:hypothetical protein
VDVTDYVGAAKEWSSVVYSKTTKLPTPAPTAADTRKLEDWANDVQNALEKMTEAIKNLDARLERIEEPLADQELRKAWERNHG